jgi:hypothetical protein
MKTLKCQRDSVTGARGSRRDALGRGAGDAGFRVSGPLWSREALRRHFGPSKAPPAPPRPAQGPEWPSLPNSGQPGPPPNQAGCIDDYDDD